MLSEQGLWNGIRPSLWQQVVTLVLAALVLDGGVIASWTAAAVLMTWGIFATLFYLSERGASIAACCGVAKYAFPVVETLTLAALAFAKR